MRKFIPFIAIALVVLVAIPTIIVFSWTRGPHRSYRVDYVIQSEPTDEPLQVGAAMRDITPDFEAAEPWTDVDGNNRFDPEKGDTYEDVNGNGRPDLIWLGGFAGNRPATGVHDPLWARAIALKRGGMTIALVSIDSVGMTHDLSQSGRNWIRRWTSIT